MSINAALLGSGPLVTTYDAYGKLLDTEVVPLTNWLFGGDGIYDPASGFTYHLARWRDGGRFVSYDSFEADPSSPAALYKYLYASASPERETGARPVVAMLKVKPPGAIASPGGSVW